MRKREWVWGTWALVLAVGWSGTIRGGGDADHVFTVAAREPGGGTILPLHGVNDGPMLWPPRTIKTLKGSYLYLGIPAVRTHDFYGPTDIVGLFPDWSRDPEDPTAYDFTNSDAIIGEIIGAGEDVFYRIGYSWEDSPVHNVPPDDFDKFAQIAAHIVGHYNQGWNNGFFYGIRDWEIWNEPDTWQFWTGTPEQFFDLYERTSRRMRQADPTIQIGGSGVVYWASSNYRDRFVRYCRERGVPLDFFSWHRYFETEYPDNYRTIGKAQRVFLDGQGLPQARSILTEWNYGYPDEVTYPERCDLRGAAWNCIVLSGMADGEVDAAYHYRGDFHGNNCESFGLHWGNGERKTTAYALKAWDTIVQTPYRRMATGSDWRRHTIMAGRSEDGRQLHVLLANVGDTEVGRFDLTINQLGACEMPRTITRLILESTGFTVAESYLDVQDSLRLRRPGAAPSVTLVLVDGVAPWPAHLAAGVAECPSGLTLDWDPVSEASGYAIFRSAVSCEEALAAPVPTATVTDNHWTDSTVEQGRTYCYAVAPLGAYGSCDGDRRPVTGFCPNPTPEQIGQLRVKKVEGDLVLTWPAAVGAAHYRVFRSVHPDSRTWGYPWRTGVTDGDASAPGVQWVDSGAGAPSTPLFFYSVEGEAPPLGLPEK